MTPNASGCLMHHPRSQQKTSSALQQFAEPVPEVLLCPAQQHAGAKCDSNNWQMLHTHIVFVSLRCQQLEYHTQTACFCSYLVDDLLQV